MLTDAQVVSKYGQPGDFKNFVTVPIPYPMRIDWDRAKEIHEITCHKGIKDRLLKVFDEILAHYGKDKIRELGIDLFGGCIAIRKMRGSTTRWSRHSWGIALDLDPQRNGLKTKWKDAQFSKPEYQAMVDAFHRNGFIGYGPDRGYDSMHWEIAD